MKKFIKIVVTGFLHYSGLVHFFVFIRRLISGSDKCIVLTYHRILPAESSRTKPEKWEAYRSLPGIVVSPEVFAQQMAFIVKRYKVIPLMELLECLEQGKSIPRRSVVLTFDDGWRDNFVYAFPVLRKYEIPATIFLTTGLIGTAKLFWPEKLLAILTGDDRAGINTSLLPVDLFPPSVKQLIEIILKGDREKTARPLEELIRILKSAAPNSRDRLIEQLQRQATPDPANRPDERVMLNWDEIKTMHESGISFGSHGVQHEILTRIENEQQIRELHDSKKTLDEHLTSALPVFAYPNGNYNRQLQEMAQAAGYRCAFSVERGPVRANSDAYALRRFNVHEGVSTGPAGGFSPALFGWYLERRVY